MNYYYPSSNNSVFRGMKMRKSILTVFILALSFFIVAPTAEASSISDGTYTVPYTIKSSNGGASIADGYFTGSANVTVKNGSAVAELTVSSGQYVKSLNSSSGSGSLISESGDTKIFSLPVGDITQPETVSMHVVVPEEVAKMDYDTTHTTTFVFNTNNLPTATGDSNDTPKTANDTTQTNAVEQGDVENPKTADNTPLALYVALLIISGVGFVAFRKKSIS